MRDEGCRSAIQVMNMTEVDFLLRRREFIGEAEQVTAAVDEGTPSRLTKGEEVPSPDAATPMGRPAVGSDPEERQNDEHIRAVLQNLPAELDLDQHATAEKFIRDRAELFSRSDYDLGRTNLIQHVIDTGMHRPFKQPLRRHPLADREVIDKHVPEMLQNDVIEPAISLWASNVILVRKSNEQKNFDFA